MKAGITFPILLLTAACARSVTTTEETIPGKGIDLVTFDSDRGDLDIVGDPRRTDYRILFESSAYASGQTAADRREEDNTFAAEVTGSLLDIYTRSPSSQARVDVGIDGPAAVDLDLVLRDGTANVSNVEGVHLITADRVVMTQVLGNVDLYADSGGIDAEIWPYENGTVIIEAYGDTVLYLPWGLDYDIDAFVDPKFPYEVAELGYDFLNLDFATIRAFTGNRTVRVEVYVSNGSFSLLELDPWF